MLDFFADMETQEQKTLGPQDPPHLAQCLRHVGGLKIHNGIERRDSGPRVVPHIKRSHIPLTEFNARIELSSLRDHARRKIHSAHCASTLVQVSSHLAGTTAQVADNSQAANAVYKPIEQLPVEWLVPQLVIKAPRVFVSHAIITRLNFATLLLNHGL